MYSATNRTFSVFAVLVLLLPAAAAADVIVLTSGRQMTVAVREISDGTVWFLSNGEIHSLPLVDTRKILIADAVLTGQTTAASAATAAAPAQPAAPAVPATPPPPPPPLELVSTASGYDRGVLTVQGEVRNNTSRELRYVQLHITLHDENDSVLTSTMLYVPGETPHLQPGETRAFRGSFLNPPPTTYKYKVRAVSRSLDQQ